MVIDFISQGTILLAKTKPTLRQGRSQFKMFVRAVFLNSSGMNRRGTTKY